ncbi:hypothetical protein D3C72_2358930 [compost metagenome]
MLNQGFTDRRANILRQGAGRITDQQLQSRDAAGIDWQRFVIDDDGDGNASILAETDRTQEAVLEMPMRKLTQSRDPHGRFRRQPTAP